MSAITRQYISYFIYGSPFNPILERKKQTNNNKGPLKIVSIEYLVAKGKIPISKMASYISYIIFSYREKLRYHKMTTDHIDFGPQHISSGQRSTGKGRSPESPQPWKQEMRIIRSKYAKPAGLPTHYFYSICRLLVVGKCEPALDIDSINNRQIMITSRQSKRRKQSKSTPPGSLSTYTVDFFVDCLFFVDFFVSLLMSVDFFAWVKDFLSLWCSSIG